MQTRHFLLAAFLLLTVPAMAQDQQASSTNHSMTMPKAGYNVEAYLAKNVRYPADAKTQKLEGKVYVRFSVSTTGKIGNVKVVNGLSESCDKEAARVVASMPDWKPGNSDGHATEVTYTTPVEFKL